MFSVRMCSTIDFGRFSIFAPQFTTFSARMFDVRCSLFDTRLYLVGVRHSSFGILFSMLYCRSLTARCRRPEGTTTKLFPQSCIPMLGELLAKFPYWSHFEVTSASLLACEGDFGITLGSLFAYNDDFVATLGSLCGQFRI